MEAISVGPVTQLLQNTVYALPAVSVFAVQITAGATFQTSLDGTNFTTTTSVILTGAFAKCTSGSITITLRKNGVG